MTTATMLDAALEYAERQAPVFPIWWTVAGRCACGNSACESPGKHPIPDVAPNGFQNATADRAVIRQWWTRYPLAHIGMLTGSWCAVLDVDPGKGGDVALAALEHEHGPLPATAEVLTGGGGRHIYFAAVPGLRNSSGKVRAGLDIRAEGGYVLVPPSGHVSGSVYVDEVLHPLFETPLAPMPGWLVTRARRATPSNGTGPGEVTDWIGLLVDEIEALGPAYRYNARMLRSAVQRKDEAETAMAGELIQVLAKLEAGVG